MTIRAFCPDSLFSVKVSEQDGILHSAQAPFLPIGRARPTLECRRKCFAVRQDGGKEESL